MVSQEASKLHVEPNSVDPANFVQQETVKRTVVQTMFDPACFEKRAGRNMLNHFYIACLLLNKLAGSKLFDSKCNLLVSCETTREVVQILFDPARFNKRAGSNTKQTNHLFQHKSLSPSSLHACWVDVLVERHVCATVTEHWHTHVPICTHRHG